MTNLALDKHVCCAHFVDDHRCRVRSADQARKEFAALHYSRQNPVVASRVERRSLVNRIANATAAYRLVAASKSSSLLPIRRSRRRSLPVGTSVRDRTLLRLQNLDIPVASSSADLEYPIIRKHLDILDETSLDVLPGLF